jgi:hypothetical protein
MAQVQLIPSVVQLAGEGPVNSLSMSDAPMSLSSKDIKKSKMKIAVALAEEMRMRTTISNKRLAGSRTQYFYTPS